MAGRNNSKKNALNQQKFIANPAMMPQVFSKRLRSCPLSEEGAPVVDYKNVALLKQYISERGKILPRRISAVSSKKQRELAKAIKNARVLSLLSFINN